MHAKRSNPNCSTHNAFGLWNKRQRLAWIEWENTIWYNWLCVDEINGHPGTCSTIFLIDCIQWSIYLCAFMIVCGFVFETIQIGPWCVLERRRREKMGAQLVDTHHEHNRIGSKKEFNFRSIKSKFRISDPINSYMEHSQFPIPIPSITSLWLGLEHQLSSCKSTWCPVCSNNSPMAWCTVRRIQVISSIDFAHGFSSYFTRHLDNQFIPQSKLFDNCFMCQNMSNTWHTASKR